MITSARTHNVQYYVRTDRLRCQQIASAAVPDPGRQKWPTKKVKWNVMMLGVAWSLAEFGSWESFMSLRRSTVDLLKTLFFSIFMYIFGNQNPKMSADPLPDSDSRKAWIRMMHFAKTTWTLSRSRIRERTISLRFLGILRVLRLEVSLQPRVADPHSCHPDPDPAF
jgi:hypothetical protein